MLSFELKLYPTVKLKDQIDLALFQHVSVYNTALTKAFLFLNQNAHPISEFDLIREFSGHGKKAGLNQDSIAERCKEVARSVMRWVYPDASGKRLGKPKRKSKRRKITTLQFGQASKLRRPEERRIRIPGIGLVKCSQQDLPEGKIMGGRLKKRASGYYFQFLIQRTHEQEFKKDAFPVGVDPGFSSLLTLSDGTKIENPRELRKTEEKIAQAQRGKNRKKVARAHEKLRQQRKDRNHKISHDLVRDYSEIVVSEDRLKAMARLFGKSVSEASLGQLMNMIAYKAHHCGRRFVKVSAKNTTRMCGKCWRLTGPTGLANLGVRAWNCVCGAQHDRDINAACVILGLGQGMPSVEKINTLL